MDQAAKLIGCLAKIAINGAAYTAPSAGTTSRTNIPPNDATNGSGSIWPDLGIIAKATEKFDSTKVEIFRPTPGKYMLDDELEAKVKRTLTLTIEECSNVMWLLLRRALKPTSPLTGNIGQFVPLSVSNVKCWMKFQRYGEDDALVDAEQLWSKISIDNAVEYGPEKNVQFELTVKQLWSPLTSSTAN